MLMSQIFPVAYIAIVVGAFVVPAVLAVVSNGV